MKHNTHAALREAANKYACKQAKAIAHTFANDGSVLPHKVTGVSKCGGLSPAASECCYCYIATTGGISFLFIF